MADDPYAPQRVRAAIAELVAELGVEVSWRGDRMVLRGHLDAGSCREVLEAARAAASPIEIVDELDHAVVRAPDRRAAERIEP